MLNKTSSQSEEVIGEIKSVMPTPSQPKLLENPDQSESDLSQPQEELDWLPPQPQRKFSNSPESVTFSPHQEDPPEPREISSKLLSTPFKILTII